MTTFTKINGLDTRNVGDTGMLYSHGGAEAGTASFCRTHNLHSTDAAAIVDFARKQFRTMGFCFLYAVKGDKVVSLMKQGHFAQRDLKPFITEGYTEFFYSSAFTCKIFMLPDGRIVEQAEAIDCSPKKTTTIALRFGRAMGLV
jgi:hypothetical protein